MKYLFLALIMTGLMIPLACTNTAPTGTTFTKFNLPTATATGQYTATPTATFLPTPAYVSTFSTDAPNGIAYSTGSIYVAEGYDETGPVSQVQVFNASNNSLAWTWTASGSTPFQYPNGIAVNAAGTTVYVLDAGNQNTGNGAVYALAPAATPTPITSWSTFGGKSLSYPGGIALDSSGNVYVADTGNGLLEEFGSAGATIASWSSKDVYPMAVAVDASGGVYVADGNNEELFVLSPSGSSFVVANQWYLPYADSGNNLAVYGVAVDGSKNVYVADYYNSQVEVYANTGSLLGAFTGNQTGAIPLAGPDGLLLYNNDIYVADFDTNNYSNNSGMIEIFGPNNY